MQNPPSQLHLPKTVQSDRGRCRAKGPGCPDLEQRLRGRKLLCQRRQEEVSGRREGVLLAPSLGHLSGARLRELQPCQILSAARGWAGAGAGWEPPREGKLGLPGPACSCPVAASKTTLYRSGFTSCLTFF